MSCTGVTLRNTRRKNVMYYASVVFAAECVLYFIYVGEHIEMVRLQNVYRHLHCTGSTTSHVCNVYAGLEASVLAFPVAHQENAKNVINFNTNESIEMEQQITARGDVVAAVAIGPPLTGLQ